MNIVTNTFKTFLKQKPAIINSLNSILRISDVFLCFCNLCILLFFYLELFKYG